MLGKLGNYLNAAGLLADLAGEPEAALSHYTACETIVRRAAGRRDRSISLQNLASVEASLGSLRDAVGHAGEALNSP